jgi:peptide/nickel transport system permease protein
MQTTLANPTLPQPAEQESRAEVASQWKLMWWKFRKHKLAVVGGVVMILAYIVVAFCEFFAPWLPDTYNNQYVYAPPQTLHFFRDGGFAPHVYGYKFERDPQSFKKTWTIDESKIIPVGLFVRGEPYQLWGFIPMDRRLIGPQEADQPFFLVGTDKNGRDVLSRTIFSARVSLTVCLVNVFLTLILGIALGGLSGLVGGWVDGIIQRVIDVLLSVPQLPIWLALASVVPLSWSPLQVYFMITIIISLMSWTYMARVVRGKFLSLREEDFILAARLDGVGNGRLIARHMLPSFMSHVIASITLAIPGMILAETSLSFLGVGLRPPIVSWGVMLQDAQKVATIATYPWLLFPGLAVVLVVLALNFLGDGLRDAADPYA